MRKLFTVFALLLLCITSAFAGPTFVNGSIIAELVGPGTEIDFSNMGTAPFISCGDPTEFEGEICSQAFQVCVDGAFDVGAVGTVGVNLLPSSVGGSLGRPFFYNPNGSVHFMTATPLTSPPQFALSQVPKGKLIYLMTENRPTNGSCVGVRTTFTFDPTNCKLCKIRKWFNTCNHTTNITQIKEWERICDPENLEPGAGGTSVHGLSVLGTQDDEEILFFAVGNGGWNPTGSTFPHIPSKAGSVPECAIDFDTGGVIGPCDMFSCNGSLIGPGNGPWLEIFLSFTPGGVKLAPFGRTGNEKFTQVCVQINNFGDGE